MGKRIGLLLFAVSFAVAAAPEFEVASVKQNLSGGRGGARPGLRNGRFTAGNASLKSYLGHAYSLPEAQISGPDWLDSQHFDIAATVRAGTQPEETAAMLRALLEDRFHLHAHHVAQEMNYFSLTIGKSGSKLKEIRPGKPVPAPNFGPGAPSAMIMTNGTVAFFAASLARSLGRPVIDRTGLSGEFHVMLAFTPATSQGGDPGPDIFTAVQEQLGLKLDPQKGPVDLLKVDSIDKIPIEN